MGPSERRVSAFRCGLIVLLGLIEAACVRHAMRADGISYLDMGDAILRGDGRCLQTLCGVRFTRCCRVLALKVLRPCAFWEFTVVHLLNFLIYAFALGCFDYLLRSSIPIRSKQS
jgi:hypothetical protein